MINPLERGAHQAAERVFTQADMSEDRGAWQQLMEFTRRFWRLIWGPVYGGMRWFKSWSATPSMAPGGIATSIRRIKTLAPGSVVWGPFGDALASTP